MPIRTSIVRDELRLHRVRSMIPNDYERLLTFRSFDQSGGSGFVGIDSVNKQIVVAYTGSADLSNYISE